MFELKTSHAVWLKLAGADVKDAQDKCGTRGRVRRRIFTSNSYPSRSAVWWSDNVGAVDGSARILFAIVRKLDRTKMGKSLKAMVARDGVEPPTPAFSGLCDLQSC